MSSGSPLERWDILPDAARRPNQHSAPKALSPRLVTSLLEPSQGGQFSRWPGMAPDPRVAVHPVNLKKLQSCAPRGLWHLLCALTG